MEKHKYNDVIKKTEHEIPQFSCRDKGKSLIGQFFLAFREALEAELAMTTIWASQTQSIGSFRKLVCTSITDKLI